MYYDDVFIDYLTKDAHLVGDAGSFVQRAVAAVAPQLIEKPELYLTYGVYWWAVKSALQKYADTPDAWYMAHHDDPVMKQRAWHGSEFRTILAAVYYQKKHPICCSMHRWTDAYGVEHGYVLHDPDAPCVLAEAVNVS